MTTRVGVLEVRLFGRFEVVRNGTQIPEKEWGQRKVKSLFALLLSQPGRVFSHDVLIDGLFEEADPERVRSSLYALVSRLRRTLEPDLGRGVDSKFVVREGQGYRFNVEGPCWIDTTAFARFVDEGEKHQREGRNAEATEAFECAVALYRGEFLEADRYEEWTLEARERWRERYITALTGLADGYANAGDCHRAVMACRTAFDLRPSQESVLQQLMKYHHAAGERSEALRVYEHGVEALKRDLDVDPSAETKALRRTVMEDAAPMEEMARDRTRIAVLPFVNQSPDPEDEYFADGLTEELIYSLSKVRDLKVIAQTSSLSYKGTKKTVGLIGRELSIGSLLEGSVRKAQDKLRITIQLIDVESEAHLWSEAYEREFRDVFAIQREIAQEVAGALRVALLEEEVEELAAEPTADLEAYTSYIKGQQFLRAEAERPIDFASYQNVDLANLTHALEHFERAVAADERYALAWSGLADALCLHWFLSDAPDECLRRAEEASGRAVELDPGLGEGHASQALTLWIGRKRLQEAEQLLQRAAGMSPRSPMIRRWHARMLTQLGRSGEALLEALRALEVDPLSSWAGIELADLRVDSGSIDDAIRDMEGILRLDPGRLDARLRLARYRMISFDWESAEAEYLKAVSMAPSDPRTHLGYADLLLTLGRKKEAAKAMRRGLSAEHDSDEPAVLSSVGFLHYRLGDFEEALSIFGRLVRIRPRHRGAHWWSGICHWRLGNYDAALEFLSSAGVLADGFYRRDRAYYAIGTLFAQGLIFASMGDVDRARETIPRMVAFPEDSQRPLGVAAVHFHLGELDQGFERLRQAVERRSIDLHWIDCLNLPREVTQDPRYAGTMQPTGLPTDG